MRDLGAGIRDFGAGIRLLLAWRTALFFEGSIFSSAVCFGTFDLEFGMAFRSPVVGTLRMFSIEPKTGATFTVSCLFWVCNLLEIVPLFVFFSFTLTDNRRDGFLTSTFFARVFCLGG